MTVAFGAAQVLFPTGNARLTTLLAFAAFIALAAQRRSWLPVLACMAWLSGFEAALNLTLLALGRAADLDRIHFIVYLALAVLIPIGLARRGYPPSWPLLAGAALVWIIWVAAGFHVNGHSMVGFSAPAEVWNETSKLLWAAAYFLPLVRLGEIEVRRPAPEMDEPCGERGEHE